MKTLTAEDFIKLSRFKRDQITDYVRNFVGIPLKDIRQFEIPEAGEDQNYLTITVYLNDDHGRRYLDRATGQAAKETQRKFVRQPFPEY